MNLSVLKNRNYVLVILGRLVSEFGTYLESFALSLYVLKKTGSSALFATVIMVALIPRILLMPFAGVIADKFSRKKMVVRMDILSGLVVMAACAALYLKGELSLGMIYVFVIALNTISVFFTPAMNSMMPDIVEKEKLPDANSLMEIGAAIIAVTAPIVAGILYSGFGLLIILLFDAISFWLSSLSESFIKIEKESLISKENQQSFFSNFKDGIKYIIGMPEFLIIGGVAIIANFALGPIFSIALPVVILKDFELSETVYGIITALMTIGMFVGPLFAAGIVKKYHYSKLVSFILTMSGVICGLIAVSFIKGIFPNLYYNTVIMLVLINMLMIIIIWVNLATTTARQRIVPGELQGRVSSAVGMVAMMAMPAGQGLMGYLLDYNKSYVIVGIFAVIVLVSGLLAKVGFAHLERTGKMQVKAWDDEDRADAIQAEEAV